MDVPQGIPCVLQQLRKLNALVHEYGSAYFPLRLLSRGTRDYVPRKDMVKVVIATPGLVRRKQSQRED
jgi:hypothetical protein